MHKVSEIKALDSYRLWLRFSDGTEGIVDLSHLRGKGVFKIWAKDVPFKDAYIDQESGAIAWSPEIDICPDSLYFKIKNINPEVLFSNSYTNASNK